MAHSTQTLSESMGKLLGIPIIHLKAIYNYLPLPIY